jgi:hypothetical protein
MSVIPEQQQETELITGTISGIVDKGGGKWQVAVVTDPSAQYARNLWSSDAALVGQLATMIGQQQTFLCRISNWKRNDGSDVRSLWIQGVGPQAQQAQQVAPQAPVVTPVIVTPQAQPMGMTAAQPQVRTEDVREARIHRQTASKVAAILISHLPSEQRTYDNLILISERLTRYYEHGLAAFGNNPTAPEHDGDPGPQGMPHGDDDIPF